MAENDLPISRANVAQAYEELMHRYPLFFRAAHFPATHPCDLANQGITCGFGWYSLIDKAACSIEGELRAALMTISKNNVLASVERRMQGLTPDILAGDEGHEEKPHALIPFCRGITSENGKLSIDISSGYLESGQAWFRIREAADLAYAISVITCETCGSKTRRYNTYRCPICQSSP
ncbi:MAG: hypothetical protein AB7U63_16815 [Porticoccaceae bacterium]